MSIGNSGSAAMTCDIGHPPRVGTAAFEGDPEIVMRLGAFAPDHLAMATSAAGRSPTCPKRR